MTPFIGPLSQVTVVKLPSAVEGISTVALNQELNMDLKGGEKKEFRFDITKEEKINLQVLSGQEDLASRFILNGESVVFIEMASWRFDKQNIFEPIKVSLGDVLELKFQNLAEESSEYVIKVFPNKDENGKIE